MTGPSVVLTIQPDSITTERRDGNNVLQLVTATGDGRLRLIDSLMETVARQLGRAPGQASTTIHTMDLFPSGGIWLMDGETVTGLWVVRPWSRPITLSNPAALNPRTGSHVASLPTTVTTFANGLLMGARWRGSIPQFSFLWAVNEVPTHSGVSMQVTPWPCGNVYDVGKICWGELATGLARIAPEPRYFRQLEDAFFHSTFNTDLLYAHNRRFEGDKVEFIFDRGFLSTPLALANQIRS